MLMDMGAVSKVVDEQGYVFDLWPGEEGTGYLPMDKLAVSASSTQQEQAVNFVKLMLGEEYQKMNTGSGFPVNRAESWRERYAVFLWLSNRSCHDQSEGTGAER